MAPPVRVSTLVGIASALLFGGSLVTMPDDGPRATAASQDVTSTSAPSNTNTPQHYPAITWTLPGQPSDETSKAAADLAHGAAADIPPGASGEERATYAALAALAVKGRAPKTGYDRDLFGQEWSDDVDVEAGHNGCDTRNDILRRDLTDVVIKRNSNGCSVLTGTLNDPYTGGTIDFVRGQGTSTAVQIDHVVSLSDAWQKGAQQWDAAKRQNFANDPRNLLAVDGSANQQKSDGDAATWLPPNKSFRCTMVTMQINVKADYGLAVTQAEHDAMKRVLDECSGTNLPGPVPPLMRDREEPVTTTTTVAPPPIDPPAQVDPPTNSSFAFYKNCAAARAAGVAPLHRGDPGYRSALDRDGDGVACE